MRTALRCLLAALGSSAVLIALSILLQGAAATAALGEGVYAAISGWQGPPTPAWPATMDSELRFYAALWLAYGVLALRTAHRFDDHASLTPWLAGVFFAGGIGRALSWAALGPPHPFFLLLMWTELTLPIVMIGLWLQVRRNPPRSRTPG